MKLESTFSIGDKVWVCQNNKPWCGTIGLVRVEIIFSPGVNDGAVEPGIPLVRFDNYKPQESFSEDYMLVETGIGSGSVYDINDERTSIFATEAECQREIDAMLAKAKLRTAALPLAEKE